MLSILIPCYNFSVFNLVKDLHQQAELQKIHFECIISSESFWFHKKDNKIIGSLQKRASDLILNLNYYK